MATLNRIHIRDGHRSEDTKAAVRQILAAAWRTDNLTAKRPEGCDPRGADEVEAGLPYRPSTYADLTA